MDSNKENITVTTTDVDENKLELTIIQPGYKILQDAQMAYNVKMTLLIRQSASGGERLLSREQLERHLEDLGIWTTEDAQQFLRLQLELRESELKLQNGGIKISDAKAIALKMKAQRLALLVLYKRRSQFDSITMESIAENHKFKFLLTKCVIDSESKMPLFSSIDDYDNRQYEKASIDAATALAGKIYGYDEQTEANLVENKWLTKFKFADNNGRLINENGHLVDVDGRLINEDGRFVDDKGNFVDDKGRRIDDNGNFVINDTKPFLDENGNPVDGDGNSITEITKKSKCIKRKIGSKK